MRLSAGLCAAAAALLLVPTAADAAKWRGKTKQGRLAVVVTGADGLVSKVRIRYRASCGDNKTLSSGVVFRPPFDVSTTTAFADGGPFIFELPGGERGRGHRVGRRRPAAVRPLDRRLPRPRADHAQRALRHELPLEADRLEGEPGLSAAASRSAARTAASAGRRSAPARVAVNTVRSAGKPGHRADGDALVAAGEGDLGQQRHRVTAGDEGDAASTARWSGGARSARSRRASRTRAARAPPCRRPRSRWPRSRRRARPAEPGRRRRRGGRPGGRAAPARRTGPRGRSPPAARAASRPTRRPARGRARATAAPPAPARSRTRRAGPRRRDALRRSASMAGSSRCRLAVWNEPTRTTPATAPAAAAARSASARSTPASSCSAWAVSTSAASVSRTRRPAGSNSAVPASRSSTRSCWDTVDGL